MLNALLPGICLLCDRTLEPPFTATGTAQICAPCHAALPWNHPRCATCAAPLAATGQECDACPPELARVVAPLRYEAMVQTWVQRLKFRNGVVEGRMLAHLVMSEVERAYEHEPLPDVVVPVPLSYRRLARRGHNQALTIAIPVARRLGMVIDRTRLRRRRHTPAQTGQSRRERQRNVADAFASRPWPETRIALVDDVMTTGATARAVARTLLDAGAAEVSLWVAARTPPKAPSTGSQAPTTAPC